MRWRLALAIGARIEAAAGAGAQTRLPLHAARCRIRRRRRLLALALLLVQKVERICMRIVVEHAIAVVAPFVIGICGRVAWMVLIAGQLLGRGLLLAFRERAKFAKHLRLLRLLFQRAAVGLVASLLLLLLIGAIQYEGVAAL